MRKINLISVFSVIIASTISIPILYVFKNIFNNTEFEVLPRLVVEALNNTLIMILVTGIFSVVIASSIAWIVNIYEFKGRRIFQILLMLPFGMPPYIMAQAYGDLFSYTGFFSAFLRNNFNIRFSIDMLNIQGAVFIYIFSLFPYIYIFCNSYYNKFAAPFVENSRLLGVTGFEMFKRVGFPIARIPIIAGVSLIIMEIVSDYGVVSYYGIQAFTTIFYKIWISFGDFSSAIKLAAFVMFIVFIFLYFEKRLSAKMRYYSSTKSATLKRIKPRKKESIFIYTYLSSIVLISLGLPIFELLYNNYYRFFDIIDFSYIMIIFNTILYCSIGAFIAICISFLLVNYIMNSSGFFSNFVLQVATLGYSIPGIIIAIAVMFSFHDLDRLLSPLYNLLNIDKVLFLSSSVFVLVFAYVVRFLTISFNQIYSSRNKFNPNIFEASRMLGKSQFNTMINIELKLLSDANVIAFLLVFLEILKELPITLLLKPISLNTLTIQVHKYYVNEMIAESSVPSLMIVIIGMFLSSIIMLYKEKVDNYVKNK